MSLSRSSFRLLETITNSNLRKTTTTLMWPIGEPDPITRVKIYVTVKRIYPIAIDRIKSIEKTHYIFFRWFASKKRKELKGQDSMRRHRIGDVTRMLFCQSEAPIYLPLGLESLKVRKSYKKNINLLQRSISLRSSLTAIDSKTLKIWNESQSKTRSTGRSKQTRCKIPQSW